MDGDVYSFRFIKEAHRYFLTGWWEEFVKRTAISEGDLLYLYGVTHNRQPRELYLELLHHEIPSAMEIAKTFNEAQRQTALNGIEVQQPEGSAELEWVAVQQPGASAALKRVTVQQPEGSAALKRVAVQQPGGSAAPGELVQEHGDDAHGLLQKMQSSLTDFYLQMTTDCIKLSEIIKP